MTLIVMGRRRGNAISVVQPFFQDDFTGGQRNNANGFTWNSTTSRVAPVADFGGAPALRFRFGPDALGSETSAEQRFDMGRDLSELWMDYDVHIPSNFALRNDPPANNKFLALWPLNYSTIGETYVVTEFDRNGTDTSYARMLGYGDMFYADNNVVIRGGDAIQNSNFISAARAGAWHRIRVHYKLASGAGQTNGVYEGWIGTSLMWRSRTDWQFWSTGGLNYVRRGYLMGTPNSGYTDETDFHIRSFKLYDQNPGWSDL